MGRLLIDPALPEGAKFIGAPELAFSLHVKALCYCARALTDGFVPASKVYGLVNASRQQVNRAIVHLATTQPGATNPSWERRADGWFLHDYDDPVYMNPMRAEVAELTEKRRMAAKKGGLTSVLKRRQKYGSAQPVKSTDAEALVSSAAEPNLEPLAEADASRTAEPSASGLASSSAPSPPKQTSKHPSRSQPNLPSPPSVASQPDTVPGDRVLSSTTSGDDAMLDHANGSASRDPWATVSAATLVGHVMGWFLAWRGWSQVKADTRRDLELDARAIVALGVTGSQLHAWLDELAAIRDRDQVNRLSYFWQPIQDLQQQGLKGQSSRSSEGPTRIGDMLPASAVHRDPDE